MQIGMIGLGKMGMNMTKRLINGGHRVVVYNRTPDKIRKAARAKAVPSYSLDEMVKALKPPRVIWIMVPAAAVEVHVPVPAVKVEVDVPGVLVIDRHHVKHRKYKKHKGHW